jgi:DNA topoisomerase-1
MNDLPDSASLEKLSDPVYSAHAAGLRYVTDQSPGIRRRRKGKSFVYTHPSGGSVRDADTVQRMRSLAIPPAWANVWICPHPTGHLQATGRDARGRKQFLYHPRWREIRDETKYARMTAFARALPRIRRRVRKDIATSGLGRKKVLATVVRLLEVSLIRIGNDEYARDNESFGLTTMRDKHVDVNGSRMRFHFRGKSGKWHDVDIHNSRLAKIVKNCQDIPGQDLFQYIDEDGQRRDVGSGDVNAYLQEVSGQDFTAKDFRTWAGTVLAAMALREFRKFDTRAQAKKNVVAAIESVAKRLGNTPAVCRKCYIHPHVLDSYLDGTLVETLQKRAEKTLARSLARLTGGEAAVLALLQQRLSMEQRLERAIRKEKQNRKARSRRPATRA